MRNLEGWLPSPPDSRDYPALYSSVITELQDKFSLRPIIKEVLDQGSEPWCVAFSVCNAITSVMEASGIYPPGGLSKVYLYKRCKELDGIPNEKGTYIRVALKIALNEGICPEKFCPTQNYLGKGMLPTITSTMRKEAAKYKIASYSRILNTVGTNFVSLDGIKKALVDKSPVIIGTWVTKDNWLDGDNYIITPEGSLLGGHATFQHSYNDNAAVTSGVANDGKAHKGFITGLNSWGTDWGAKGHYFMAYDYTQWGSKGITTDGSLIPCLQEAWAFKINGEVNINTVISDIPMQIVKDRAVLPFRAIYETIGAAVDWYYNTEKKIVATAVLNLNGSNIKIITTQGSNEVKIISGGTTKTIISDIPMQIVHNRTVLPFRVIYEALGATVDWYYNAERKIVAVATIKINGQTVTIESVEGSKELRVFKRNTV